LDFGFPILDWGTPKSPNPTMNEQEFKKRTKQLALRVIELADELPRRRTADVIGRQLVRSGTSVGANYRSACRGKSTADVIAKLAIVEEEADETIYWLELLVEAKIVPNARVVEVVKEANEIVAMTVASIKTLRGRK
jgi:four helix bundle protein